MIYLTGYSPDVDAVNSGAWDIALDASRMSREAVDALGRGDVAAVDSPLERSRAESDRVAALALSPLIGDDVIRSLEIWRTGLEGTKGGMTRKNAAREPVGTAAVAMVKAKEILDDRFLAAATRVSIRIRLIIAWGATGCIPLGGIAAPLASTAIARPVRRLRARVVELAADPVSGEVRDTERRDELGDMARALGRLVTAIRERETGLTRANDELSAAHRELERAAAIDSLTGPRDRRRLDEILDERVESARKADSKTSTTRSGTTSVIAC